MVEWMARETEASKRYLGARRNLAFRYNLLDHIGAVSSLRETASPTYPRCLDELKEPVLFRVEVFNALECPKDDLWPCPPRPLTPSFGAVHTGAHGAQVGAAAAASGGFTRVDRWPHLAVAKSQLPSTRGQAPAMSKRSSRAL